MVCPCNFYFHEIFTARNYNDPCLRTQSKLQQPHVNSVNNGENSLRFFGPIVWNNLRTSIKNVDSLHNFKRLVKKKGNLLIVLADFEEYICYGECDKSGDYAYSPVIMNNSRSYWQM